MPKARNRLGFYHVQSLIDLNCPKLFALKEIKDLKALGISFLATLGHY
jgi:hypothetical protein